MTIMKIKNIFLTLAVAVASSACSDWFDVSPKTDITICSRMRPVFKAR